VSIIEKALDKLATKDPGSAQVGDSSASSIHLGSVKLESIELDPLQVPDDGPTTSTIAADSGELPEIRIESLNSIPGVEVQPGGLGDPGVIPTTFEAPVSSVIAPVSREVHVDLARLESMGLLTPLSDNTMLAEQLRVVKRPLLLQAAGKDRAPNANLIMVASALPNEGKTSTSINLAISMAMEKDHTVLLVDADVAKSDVTKTLGVTAEKGLTDLLYDSELRVADVMLKTSIDKVSVLPAGQRLPNVTELFSAEAMRRLMLELSKRYSDRIIIFDSPPLLATSGAGVLGSLVGQIVMVVEAVRTPQRAVAEALKILGPLENIGIVLNKSREKSTFSYGYGYGYEYYVKPGN
jgi:protein-tyrosine kinase